jgi:LacI family transcriptional regulator
VKRPEHDLTTPPALPTLSTVPTIKDVAQRAGVSPSTVSHVMNNTRYVEPQTRERVLRAMADLNYQPNRLARSLRNQKTNTLGVLLPNSANPFFAQVLLGIEDASFARNYSVILGNANDDPERELSHLEVLASKQIDGVLLISTGAYAQALELLARHNMPTVMVDRSPGERPIDSIMVDNAGGGRVATEYLITLGHQRIGCITGPLLLTPSADRVVGYRSALRKAGIAPDEALIVPGDFSHEGGYRAAERLLRLGPPVTAIFACNDLMAVGAIRAVHEAGLRVPHDVSVVGFDDIPLSSFIVPPLTTVAQPAEELGRIAVDLLVQRLRDRHAPVQQRQLGVHLVERDSCAPVSGP